METIFESIREQTGYNFLFVDGAIPADNKFTVHEQGELKQVLSGLLQKHGLTYTIKDKTILVKPTPRNAVPQPIHAGAIPVKQSAFSGTVLNEQGQPLSGATIRIKGTPQTAVADEDGRFSFDVAPEGAVLVVSYTGYQSREITMANRVDVNIRLSPEPLNLSEVVVVGYGTQKRVNLTGSVATVNSEVFEGRPAATVQSAIQGALPGLTIQVGSGQPGRWNTSMNVRGLTTLNSGSNPLILVDGIPYSGLDMLNPDAIESISVLKDASSSAIYGARAANGVLLITTKSGGQFDTPVFTYNGHYGVQTPTRLPELVDGREFMTLTNEARVNAGLGRLYTEDAFTAYDAGSSPNDYNNTDWINEIYKGNAPQQNHQISVQGGKGKTGYFLSYGHFQQGGLIVGNSYDGTRNNMRLRVNTELFDRLKIDGNIGYIQFDRHENALAGTAGVFRLAQRASPLLPVRWYDEATDGWQTSNHYAYGSVRNPVDVAHNSGYDRFTSKTPSVNVKAVLNIIDGLDVSAQYGFTNSIYRTKEFNAAMYRYLSDGSEYPGNADLRNTISLSESDNLNELLNTTVTYEKNIGDHYFRGLAGYAQEYGFISSLGASRQNILMDGVEQINLGTENIQNSGTETHWALASFFGRINYNYRETYLFEANIRRDGTSRFAKDRRWGTFPSFSAGWVISNESFLEEAPWLSLLKIRGSYGELGNQNVGSDGNYYPYLTAISRIENAYPIGDGRNVGFAQGALGNSQLIWESLRMTNIGLDVQLLNNRLTFTGDYFIKHNNNALLQPVYPATIGFTSTSALPLVNMGKVESKGWEIAVGWNDHIGDLRYSFTANLADVQNEVIALGKSAPVLGNNLIREGDPLNAYFGYLTDGLATAADFGGFDEAIQRYTDPSFPTISSYTAVTQPGDIKYRDISGPDGVPDGRIDNDDRAIFGNPYPRYTYSLRGQFNWRAFDFSFFLQGVGQIDGYLYDEAIHAFINDYSIPQRYHLDRWTPENTSAKYPRLYYTQNHNREFSDYWVQDASYLRLKNVQVGYQLPDKWASRVRLSRLRVYVSADNLFTKSDYFYAYDPEVRSTSGDAYPQVKTIIAGLSLTLK
ncbi:SusC/RagA family TonB-linked outer membrane protein [Parapedobacter sp. 10938]|uniref:SusC/RagA family TonB-linked outer membrane protein n=1 Tax=Parapedobacter flavus TaxID=3110225 RepID=UPI002DBE634A|nr:TonB-dependent receptor [Parapedobacter sp. 10938]MEC3879285.1 TonB-dependent receptor [Parapedobacter sp. 10938]